MSKARNRRPSRIENLVYKMLIEQTSPPNGYGTAGWVRNRQKTIHDFIQEPLEDVIVSLKYGYFEVERTVSVFQLINGVCELDELCDKFNRINKNLDVWDGEVFGGTSIKAEKHISSLKLQYDNTYNDESDLSSVLRYYVLEHEHTGNTYVLLKIHNGIDVRGGYTDAKLFKFKQYYTSFDEYVPIYQYRPEILEYIKEGYYGDRIKTDLQHLPDISIQMISDIDCGTLPITELDTFQYEHTI